MNQHILNSLNEAKLSLDNLLNNQKTLLAIGTAAELLSTTFKMVAK